MNNVIAFHGADHKVGTSQISYCLAEYIAMKYPELNVLHIRADDGYNKEYTLEHTDSFRDLRPYVDQNSISANELKEKTAVKKNFFCISGNEQPAMGEDFSPEMAEDFVKLIKEIFSIVIIDTGSFVQSGISLGSIFAADRIFCVLTQNESTLRHFEWTQDLYNKLKIDYDGFIINKYDRYSLFEKDYIEERLLIDKSKMFVIHKHRYGDKSETNSKSLLNYKSSNSFFHDLDNLSKDILKNAGIQTLRIRKKKTK